MVAEKTEFDSGPATASNASAFVVERVGRSLDLPAGLRRSARDDYIAFRT